VRILYSTYVLVSRLLTRSDLCRARRSSTGLNNRPTFGSRRTSHVLLFPQHRWNVILSWRNVGQNFTLKPPLRIQIGGVNQTKIPLTVRPSTRKARGNNSVRGALRAGRRHIFNNTLIGSLPRRNSSPCRKTRVSCGYSRWPLT
jgi:hypothetical protein